MGIYTSLYNIIIQYIYGAETTLTADMQLTATILATIGSVFIVAIPFIIIKKVIDLLGQWR